LPPVRVRLAAVTGVPAAAVKIVENDEVPRFDGDVDLLLWPRGWHGDPRHRDRHDRRVYVKLEVWCRSRLELDESGVAEQWLVASPGGNVPLEESVCDALQNFFPLDGAGNELTFEGLSVTDGAWQRRSSKDKGWGQSVLAVDVPLRLPLTQGGGLA
jgi:hypothetical protein